MTDVRTFRAATMQEALAVVRRELGDEAVILHTRQVARRRILPWLTRKEDVEITAGLGINIRPHVTTRRREPVATEATPVSERPAVSRASSNVGPQRRYSPGSSLEDAGVELDLRHSSQQAAAFIGRVHPPVEQRRFPENRSDTTADDVSERLDAIQKMVEALSRQRHSTSTSDVPGELFHLYTDLIDSDVDDELARELIFRVREQLTPEQLNDVAESKRTLKAIVEKEMRCAGPIRPKQHGRKIVALVGPTGVGKTTTIAKLAANFRLRDGLKMGLVTVDTYRVAAVEQLRTYAEIIDLPMKVVTSPLEMRRALDEFSGLDLVLIDTAGRSPKDELQIQELKSLLTEADVDEVHLVLSMTASAKSIETTARKFAAAGTTSLVLTKLDEAAEMGNLLTVARRLNLPISYVTTGQNVPDDIEPAHAARLAGLVLGETVLQR